MGEEVGEEGGEEVGEEVDTHCTHATRHPPLATHHSPPPPPNCSRALVPPTSFMSHFKLDTCDECPWYQSYFWFSMIVG